LPATLASRDGAPPEAADGGEQTEAVWESYKQAYPMAEDTCRKDLACFYEDKHGTIHRACTILQIDTKKRKKKSQRYKIKYTIYSSTEEEGNYLSIR